MRAKRVFSRMTGVLPSLQSSLLALGVTGMGVLSGLLLTSPLSALFASIVGVLVYLVVIASNPLHGLLLWIASGPMAEKTINISLGAGIPDLSPSRFCAAFLCTLLLAQTSIHKRKLARFTGIDWAAILYLAGVSLSASESGEWQAGIQTIFDLYCVPILGYFLAKNLVGERNDLDKTLLTVLIIGVYAALYAFYEHATGQILFAPEESSFQMYKDSGLRVLRGLLERSDHFGSLFSMVIPVSFYLFLKAKSRGGKAVFFIALGILLAGLFLTYKRTAWIAFAVSALVMQWFYPQFRRLFISLLLIFAVTIGATWNSVSQSVIVTDRINSKKSTVEARTDGWEAAINLWTRKPVFGYGFRTYRSTAQRSGVDDDAVESEFVDILFSAGLVGLLPYLTMFILIWRDSIKLFRLAERKPRFFVDKELAVVFWGILLGYLINYTTARASNAFVSLIFYVLVGAIVGSQGEGLLRWENEIGERKLSSGTTCAPATATLSGAVASETGGMEGQGDRKPGRARISTGSELREGI